MDGSSFPKSERRVKSGPHIEKKLNADFVKKAGPGRHANGGGLYLQVDRSGARRWVLRIVVRGKRRDLGIGSARYISLAEAREKSYEYREIARAGGNPKIQVRSDEGAKITFEELARSIFAKKYPERRSKGKACPSVDSLARNIRIPNTWANGSV